MKQDDYKNTTLLSQMSRSKVMTLKIAISGKMCSGKTTLLDMITDYHDVEVCSGGADQDILQVAERFSLADPVKEVARRYFRMPEDYKDRSLLQKIGQQFRDIEPMVWINLLIDRADEYESIQDSLEAADGASMKGCAICDDVRFPNEVEALKEAGWITIRLDVDAEERKTRLQRVYGDDWENHWTNRNEVSETALDNSDFNWDFVLKNPTYSDLEQFILELYRLENLPKA